VRVLQEREVERFGFTPLHQSRRACAGDHQSRLREEVAAGRFREDLYYRLNVFPITLPPLRARRDDILPLAMRLLASHVRPVSVYRAASGRGAVAADAWMDRKRA